MEYRARAKVIEGMRKLEEKQSTRAVSGEAVEEIRKRELHKRDKRLKVGREGWRVVETRGGREQTTGDTIREVVF